MRKKTSIFWTISKEEFQALLNECYSYSDILKKKNMCVTGHQYTVIKTRIKNDNLDISNFNLSKCQGVNRTRNTKKIPANDLFCEKSGSHTCTAKKRILEENLIPYKCSKCSNSGQWESNPLTLQLDHINGNRNDHRLENLRFLCPNCHSQTNTYGKKKRN